MRCHKLVAVAADQDPPGVLSNHAPDYLGIVVGVVGVVTHDPSSLAGHVQDTFLKLLNDPLFTFHAIGGVPRQRLPDPTVSPLTRRQTPKRWSYCGLE